MASAIDDTIPATNAAVVSAPVRGNFVAAKSEITALQAQTAAIGSTAAAYAGDNSGQKAFFDNTLLMYNVAGTFAAKFSNTNTANRTYTLKDANGTIAFTSDITGTNSGTNTGDQTITLTGEATGSGTGSFATTLTNSAVIGKVLTGYVSGAGTVAATDTILQAVNKLNGNDALRVTRSGDTMTGALNWAATQTIASATTTNIAGSTSNAIIVSGTTTITGLGTIAAGAERCVQFSGILILTHNATSLILPGAANITTAAGDVAYFVSLGAGNWRCVGYQRASGAALVGGGSLTNFTEAVNTAAPNATVPVVSLTATNGATDVDAVFKPKGLGGIAAHIADNAITGGNKRGASHVDLQSDRNAATQVASGINAAIVGGRRNTASGSWATAGGNTCTASGTSATAFGQSGNSSGAAAFSAGDACRATGAQSVAMGNTATASSFRCVAIGNGPQATASDSVSLGTATDRGIFASVTYSGNNRAAAGDRNIRLVHTLSAVTTNATTTTLTSQTGAEAANNTLLLVNNSSLVFSGLVVARNTANNDTICWKVEGVASRDATAATVVFLGTPAITVVGTADASMTGCTLVAATNTTNGTATFRFTGLAATTIAVNSNFQVVENA